MKRTSQCHDDVTARGTLTLWVTLLALTLAAVPSSVALATSHNIEERGERSSVSSSDSSCNWRRQTGYQRSLYHEDTDEYDDEDEEDEDEYDDEEEDEDEYDEDEDDEDDEDDDEYDDDGDFDEWSPEKKRRCHYDPQTDHPWLQNYWSPGDLSHLFQRIHREYQEAPHYATFHARPNVESRDAGRSVDDLPYVANAPWILTMENFVTADEAAVFREWAEYEIQVEDPDTNFASEKLSEDEYEEMYADESEEEKGCKSVQAWCNRKCLKDPVVQRVIRRVEELVRMPWDFAEEAHFIRYRPGQAYTEHSDFIYAESLGMQGPRLFTLYIYWNDVPPGQGGETTFPLITHAGTNESVAIGPRLGRVLLWPNVLDEAPQRAELRTRHEAKPITHGYKYGSTFWFHLRNYSYVERLECLRDEDHEEDERRPNQQQE